MQRSFFLQSTINVAERSPLPGELRRAFDRPNAMLVNGVFVVFVELQQAASMREFGDHSLQHARFVQLMQQFAQHRRLRKDRQETLHRRGGNLIRQSSHRRADLFPSRGGNPLLIQIRQIGEPQNLRQIALQFSPSLFGQADAGPTRKSPSIKWLNTGANISRSRVQGAIRPKTARDIAHAARVPEIILHELLDRQHSLGPFVAEQFGHSHLLGPIQHVFALPA